MYPLSLPSFLADMLLSRLRTHPIDTVARLVCCIVLAMAMLLAALPALYLEASEKKRLAKPRKPVLRLVR